MVQDIKLDEREKRGKSLFPFSTWAQQRGNLGDILTKGRGTERSQLPEAKPEAAAALLYGNGPFIHSLRHERETLGRLFFL